VGDQIHPDDLPGKTLDLPTGLSQLDTTAFAPPAGMNLGLDHHRVAAQGLGDLSGLVAAKSHPPLRNGDTVFSKKFFGLVFVDFHSSSGPF
jgi:hypothetical protein